MTRIKLGIIGAGRMADWHLRAYRKISGVDVTSIANPDSQRGLQLAKQFHIASHYRDAMEMIRTHDLTAVDICVPAEHHKNYIVAALERGLHVYCEKPLCVSAQEAQAVVDANRVARRIIFNGFNYRHWTEMQRIRTALRAGKIGEIRFARMMRLSKDSPELASRNARPAELFCEYHCHFIDLLFSFGMETPSEVFACGTNVHDWPMRPDTGVVLLKFPNAALAEITTSSATPGLTPEILLVGTQGTLRLDYGQVTITPKQDEWSIRQLISLMFHEAITIPWRVLRNPFLPSCQRFVQCVLRGEPSDSDEQAALRVLKVTDAAVKSFQDGKPVSLADG